MKKETLALLSIAETMAAMSQQWPAPVQKNPKLKASRGRGNQGEHVSPVFKYTVPENHKNWNEEIERKKMEKKMKKKNKNV